MSLQRVALANPVPDPAAIDDPWVDELLDRIVATPYELPRDRRLRLVLVAAAALLLLAVPSYAVARGLLGWLGAEPAPPAVVSDFDSYARQLGFDADPGKAVLVAEDGDDFALYATTNRQGGYCLVVSAPWKRPDALPDGGSCVSREEAAKPLRAALGGASAARRDGPRWVHTFVVVGRVNDPRTRSVSITRDDGLALERPVGAGGFFIAAVEGYFLCPGTSETLYVRALADDGEELAGTNVGGFLCVTPGARRP